MFFLSGISLHEWIKEPFGAFAKAVREKLDPLLGMEMPEGKIKKYEVYVRYTYAIVEKEIVSYELEAIDEKHAEKLAIRLFNNDKSLDGDDHDIQNIEIEEI